MASLLGAFRKLYTSLRKPKETTDDGTPTDQEQDKSVDPDTPTDIVSDKSVNPSDKGGDREPSNDAACGTELANMASDDKKPVSVIDDIKAQLMTDSTASTGSDWEVLPAPVESSSHVGSDIDAQFVHIQGPDLDGTPVDQINGEHKKIDLESAEKMKPVDGDVGMNEKGDTKSGADSKNADTKSGANCENVVTKSGAVSKNAVNQSGADSKNADTKSGTDSKKADTKSGTDSKKADTKSGTDSKKADTKSGTDSKKADTKSGDDSKKADTKSGADSKNAETKKQKVCYYFSRGERCHRRKCKFAHVKEPDHTEKKDEDTDKDSEKKEWLHEKDFPNFLEYVSAMTKLNKQVNSKELMYKLGYMKGTNSQIMGEAIVGQYKVAMSKNRWYWVKDARYHAGLFFEQDWINENLPTQNQKSNKNNRNKKTKKNSNKNESYELRGGLCRDVRLLDNPDLETVTANAAGDGPLTPKLPVELGKRSTNLAAGDGNDVCSLDIPSKRTKLAEDDISKTPSSKDTPSKRTKLTKVDVSKTPRSRPDQLALGFNYHSDLVVKQSPRTVNGEIIPLDTLPTPRERPEQLAVGFNFLAEQLIRDSPKTETGEVIIPGVVVSSPMRRTRDQLAVGFNYHSDVMAKESPNLSTENSQENKNLKSRKKKAVNLNNKFDDDIENVKIELNKIELNKDESCLKTSSKLSERDTLAFGFSYNSDLVLNVPLKELSSNLTDDKDVSSLIEDAVINEGRNLVEVVDDKPVIGLPAGSVW